MVAADDGRALSYGEMRSHRSLRRLTRAQGLRPNDRVVLLAKRAFANETDNISASPAAQIENITALRQDVRQLIQPAPRNSELNCPLQVGIRNMVITPGDNLVLAYVGPPVRTI